MKLHLLKLKFNLLIKTIYTETHIITLTLMKKKL